MLIENEKVISDKKEAAEVFSKHFNALMLNLNLKVLENMLSLHENIDDPIFAAISKYQNHPSIPIIQIKHRNERFSNFTFDCIKSEIKNVGPCKATVES